jgi:hypothetical protein
MSSIWICCIVLDTGLDVLASLSVCTQLDVCNLGLFIGKVVSIDLELILHLRQPTIEGRVLSINEYRWVRDLSRLCSRGGSRLRRRLTGRCMLA